MKFLLDTHIWVWSSSEPNRLSRRVAKLLNDRRNEIWASPVSTWEVVGLEMKGRIKLRKPPETWVRESINDSPIREAVLTHQVSLASKHVVLPHRDPFDWLLAATARVFDLTFITADPQFESTKGFSVLLNL